MRQIVCLSTTNWFPQPTRKQQVMARLGGAEILYFDPPVSMAAPFKDKAAGQRISKWRGGPDIPQTNITVYATPPVLPLYNKHRALNRMNQRRIAAYVREKMRAHGFEKPILWVYHPSSVDAVKHIPHSALLYDCVDRHSAYPGLITPSVVDGMERELAAKADLVFATAASLRDTLAASNPHTHLIPNGANYELFARAGEPDLPFPNDMFNIRNPIFGFVGTIQPCIDIALIEETARRRPEWSFVLIGTPLPGVDVSALRALKNVHLLGQKPHKEIVNYVSMFDVCLNLFRSGDLSKDVSPLKFYEYLATGKPIVSTPQPDQVLEFSDVVYVASSPDEFEAKCEAALAERGEGLAARRRELGKQCSWDARVAEMERLLSERGF